MTNFLIALSTTGTVGTVYRLDMSSALLGGAIVSSLRHFDGKEPKEAGDAILYTSRNKHTEQKVDYFLLPKEKNPSFTHLSLLS